MTKVDIGDSLSADFYIKNEGDTTLVISSFSSLAEVFNLYVDTYRISPDDSQEVALAFKPDSVKLETCNLIIQSNDPANPEDTLKIVGYGVDRISPEIISVNYGEPMTIEETQPVRANVTENYGLQSVELFYRNGDSPAFESLDMTKIAEDTFGSDIPSTSITLDGIEFYLFPYYNLLVCLMLLQGF